MSTMTPCAKCRRLIYVGAFHTCPDSACYYHIPMSAQQRQASNHLAQSAQAVDVGAIREVIDFMESRSPHGAAWESAALSKLTRAISGEKAGAVGKYRLLGPNDVIEPDDECIDDNAVDWVRAGSASGGHLFIGMQYRLGVLKQARRPLPASPAPDKEG